MILLVPQLNRKQIKVFVVVALTLLIIGFGILIRRQKIQNVQTSTTSEQSAGQIISGAFTPQMQKSEEDWKKLLTPAQYHILREAGTEIPFTGELNTEKRKGTYYSVGCDVALFSSDQKYDSGTGWPSFSAPINDKAVVLRRETALGDDRIEVLDTCGGHLGHVFDDGPAPTGKRYCMNSVALRFVPDEK